MIFIGVTRVNFDFVVSFDDGNGTEVKRFSDTKSLFAFVETLVEKEALLCIDQTESVYTPQ